MNKKQIQQEVANEIWNAIKFSIKNVSGVRFKEYEESMIYHLKDVFEKYGIKIEK